jgi:pimeloyl-ACP methyl ester carboxylesterase
VRKRSIAGRVPKRRVPQEGSYQNVKRLTRTLIAGAGVTGALAATNRALQNGPLATNALGGTRLPWHWRGREIFATEAGDGPLVLLVHGVSIGASSYEFRRLFPLLARTCRVVAFDLIGCGLSEKPSLPYSPELFVEQIVDALDTFGAGPASLIASSLGAAFAIRAAARAGNRVARLAAICPAGLSGTLDRGPRGAQAALGALLRTPLAGETAYNALASKPSIRTFLKRQVYADAAHATPEVIDHYYAVAHQPGARYVPAAFVGGALDCDVTRDLPFLTTPLLVLWGERAARLNPRSNADEFLRLTRGARLATFANSGLLPHEEEPEAVNETLETFLAARDQNLNVG